MEKPLEDETMLVHLRLTRIGNPQRALTLLIMDY